MPTRPLLAAVFTLLLLAGCASSRSAPPHPVIAAPEPLADIDARKLTLIDGHSGQPLNWDSLISSAAGADAILVGEVHNHPAGQAFEAAFFDDVLAASPTAAAALEFYERDHQAVMDDYLTGVVTWTDFRRLTGRGRGDDCPGHRSMISACKAHDRPAIAANAPRRYVKLARTDGYERLAALGPEQRRLYRIPDHLPESGTRYRDDFNKIMSGAHESDPKAKPDDATATSPAPDPAEQDRIDGMFRAHSLWDWTMADSVAHAIDNPDKPSHPVVLIVGKFHTDFDGGLAQALRAIRPGSRIFTVSLENKDAKPMVADDKGTADAIVYLGADAESD